MTRWVWSARPRRLAFHASLNARMASASARVPPERLARSCCSSSVPARRVSRPSNAPTPGRSQTVVDHHDPWSAPGRRRPPSARPAGRGGGGATSRPAVRPGPVGRTARAARPGTTGCGRSARSAAIARRGCARGRLQGDDHLHPTRVEVIRNSPDRFAVGVGEQLAAEHDPGLRRATYLGDVSSQRRLGAAAPDSTAASRGRPQPGPDPPSGACGRRNGHPAEAPFASGPHRRLDRGRPGLRRPNVQDARPSREGDRAGIPGSGRRHARRCDERSPSHAIRECDRTAPRTRRQRTVASRRVGHGRTQWARLRRCGPAGCPWPSTRRSRAGSPDRAAGRR